MQPSTPEGETRKEHVNNTSTVDMTPTPEAVNERLTKLYNRMTKIHVGDCVIGTGIEDGKIWVENEIGEGMDAPVGDIEKLISKYVHENI